MCNAFLILSTISGHVGGSPPLTMVNAVIMDTGQHCRSHFLGYYEIIFLAFYKLQLFSGCLYYVAFVTKDSASVQRHSQPIGWGCADGHPKGCEVASECGLVCTSVHNDTSQALLSVLVYMKGLLNTLGYLELSWFVIE